MDQGRAGRADCGDAAGDAAAYHFVDGGLFDGRHRHSPSQAESWDEIASVNDEGPQRVQRFTDVIEHELPAIASIPTRVPIPLDSAMDVRAWDRCQQSPSPGRCEHA